MRRVVVTGVGAITPIGNTMYATWQSLRNGTNGITRITSFDTTDCPVKVAGEVKGYSSNDFFSPMEAKKLERFTEFAILSGLEAYEDSGLDRVDINHDRFSVVYGSVYGGCRAIEDYHNIKEKGYDAVTKLLIPTNLNNMAAANIAIRVKAHGSCNSVMSACSTGTDCVGKAYRDIKHGYSDYTIAGASEASINPVLIAGCAAVNLISQTSDCARACIPFDAEREGFVMGEGAGSLVLEEYEHAKKRNAKIYAEVIGYGSTCDAYSMTTPDPNLDYGEKAINMAISEAGVTKSQISYINAHGTGTKYNDRYETALFKRTFGQDIYKIPMSSTKSSMGHTLGATGAIEAIVLAKSIETGFMPPTINYSVKDSECDLDYITDGGREGSVDVALSNALGFGGHNSALVMKKVDQ